MAFSGDSAIDLAFSDSAAGALKYAFPSADILSLHLELNIGDIASSLTAPHKRGDVLDMLYGSLPCGKAAARELLSRSLDALKRISSSFAPLRLWLLEGSAQDMCGLMYICQAFFEKELIAVHVSREYSSKNGLIKYNSLGELPPSALMQARNSALPLSDEEKSENASLWAALSAQNMPLRVMNNDMLVSAGAEHFDHALLAGMPSGSFPAALAIGRTLIALSCDISDAWLFLRIKELARTGKLTELSPPKADSPYSGIFIKTEDI